MHTGQAPWVHFTISNPTGLSWRALIGTEFYLSFFGVHQIGQNVYRDLFLYYLGLNEWKWGFFLLWCFVNQNDRISIGQAVVFIWSRKISVGLELSIKFLMYSRIYLSLSLYARQLIILGWQTQGARGGGLAHVQVLTSPPQASMHQFRSPAARICYWVKDPSK